MTETEQRTAAKKFSAIWAGKGYEKGESQPFWLSLLRDVYGVDHPEQYITFEDQVHLDHSGTSRNFRFHNIHAGSLPAISPLFSSMIWSIRAENRKFYI